MSIYGTYLMENYDNYNFDTLQETINCENNEINYLMESIDVDLKYINEAVDINIKEIFKNIFEKIKTIIDKIIALIMKAIEAIRNKAANIKKGEKDDKKEETYQDFDINIKFNDDKSEKFNDQFLKNTVLVVSNGTGLSLQVFEDFMKTTSSVIKGEDIYEDSVSKLNDWVENQRYPVSADLEKKEETISRTDYLEKCYNIMEECTNTLTKMSSDMGLIRSKTSLLVRKLSHDEFASIEADKRRRQVIVRNAQKTASELIKMFELAQHYARVVSKIGDIALKVKGIADSKESEENA